MTWLNENWEVPFGLAICLGILGVMILAVADHVDHRKRMRDLEDDDGQ